MAFKLENLTPVANNTKRGVVPAMWIYWNEAGDTVTTSGYIPNNVGVSAGDHFYVIDNDKENHGFYHATITSGAVKLTANS